MDNTINLAEECANRVADRLQAFELAAGYIEGVGHRNPEDELGEGLDFFKLVPADRLHVAWWALELAVELLDFESAFDCWWHYLDTVLEVTWTGKLTYGDGWTITGAEVLVVMSSPRCWLEWECGSQSVTVRAAWGTDQFALYGVAAPGLAEALDMMADLLPRSYLA